MFFKRSCLFVIIILFSVTIFPVTLKEYIDLHSSEINYHILSEKRLKNDDLFISVSLHSQIWKGISWQHRLGIILPKNLKTTDAAVIYITGNFEDPDKMSWIADFFAAPFIILGDIPNQPLFGNLYEDELIAYSFQRFFETGEEDWALLLPMVQSVVAAMDVTQSILKIKGMELKRFLVSGASKRGWTTWLTAAVDERVFAIAPIVFDNLNFEKQLNHQLENWGDYSKKISPYTNLKLQEKFGTNLGKKLLEIVDPHSYIERLDMPKLIIQSTNDEYWTIDASQFYFYDLKGENYLLFVPNEKHSIKNLSLLIRSISEFFKALVHKGNFVKYNWYFEGNERKIFVESQDAVDCKIWISFSDNLDFRYSIWKMEKPEKVKNGCWKFEVPESDKNICYFAELIFRGLDTEFSLTTIPKIVRKED